MNIFHKWGKNQVQKAFDEMKKKKKIYKRDSVK